MASRQNDVDKFYVDETGVVKENKTHEISERKPILKVREDDSKSEAQISTAETLSF
ncbi:12154_t:CDS:2 [Rhizophagus irregularis]|nr:12154_t:CDS:2 [Rhizophagus irregularis]